LSRFNLVFPFGGDLFLASFTNKIESNPINNRLTFGNEARNKSPPKGKTKLNLDNMLNQESSRSPMNKNKGLYSTNVNSREVIPNKRSKTPDNKDNSTRANKNLINQPKTAKMEKTMPNLNMAKMKK
jgi:hypothetical protein